jgi:hypothetical protein
MKTIILIKKDLDSFMDNLEILQKNGYFLIGGISYAQKDESNVNQPYGFMILLQKAL